MKKYTVMNIVPGDSLTEQGENILNNKPLLCFNGYFHDDNCSLRDFMLDFFERNKQYYTYSVTRTSRKYHTCKNSSRSLHDIFRIVKYYYPKATIIEVKDLLLNNNNCVSSQCSMILRRVYYPGNLRTSKMNFSIRHRASKDEFGLTPIQLLNQTQ